jgi:hypothetical protein
MLTAGLAVCKRSGISGGMRAMAEKAMAVLNRMSAEQDL